MHLLAEEWCLWESGEEVGVHLQLCDIPRGSVLGLAVS